MADRGRAWIGRRPRPSRAQVDPAVLSLIERHGVQVMATARRHSVTAEDAEDAYQRGLEILLTKAPSLVDDELLPWLKQWHNDIDPEFGVPMGDYFEGFLQEESRNLGLTLDEIRAWQPPQRTASRGRRRANG